MSSNILNSISMKQEILRKLVHLSSLWMPILIYIYDRYHDGWRLHLVYFFQTMLILNLVCEYSFSMNFPIITPCYRFFFGKMLRKKVKKGEWVVSGSPPVFAAAVFACLCFRPIIAPISLSVMLLQDTSAALIGRYFGKHKTVNGKSWEGVVAFFITAVMVESLMLLFNGYCFDTRFFLAVTLSSVAAALVELFEKQLHVDDNLSIPLASGVLLTAILHYL